MTAEEQDNVFGAWMQQHQGVVLKVARAFAEPEAEQDDLAQEIRLAIWKSVPHFGGKSKASTYMYRIALNRAISWQRTHRSYRDKLARFAKDLASRHETTDPDPRLAVVYESIRKLERAERSIMLMYLDGYRYHEIAETLGLERNHVGVLINRIKTKLSNLLKENQI